MTTKEFSDAIDSLLIPHNITLDEYEKSLFLTQAQEQIVIELYSGRSNKVSSFESTEELRSNLRDLIKTEVLTKSTQNNKGVSKYSNFFIKPPDVLFITYEFATLSDEEAKCKNGDIISVIPITQDELEKVLKNPFRGTSIRRALRLDNSQNIIEIISKYNIKDYTIRYLAKPTPIVTANLAESSMESVLIDNVNIITECKLDSAIHRPILERAVALAIANRSTQNKSNV